MWPGFNSRTRCGQMWVEIVVGSRPCSEGFLSVSSGFSSLLKNQHFQISIRSGTRGPQVCQSQTVRVTLVKQSRFIFILFIYTLISTSVLWFSYCWNHMFIIWNPLTPRIVLFCTCAEQRNRERDRSGIWHAFREIAFVLWVRFSKLLKTFSARKTTQTCNSFSGPKWLRQV